MPDSLLDSDFTRPLTAKENKLLAILDQNVMRGLSHPQLTVTVLVAYIAKQGITNFNREHVKYIVNHRLLNEAALEYLFLTKKLCYAHLLTSKYCTKRMFDFVLSGDNEKDYLNNNNTDFYYFALTNPRCPMYWLEKYIKNKRSEMRAMFALSNIQCPAELLVANYSTFQDTVLEHPNCPMTILEDWHRQYLAQDAEVKKQAIWVAKNPQCPPAILKSLYKGNKRQNFPNDALDHALFSNPNFPFDATTRDKISLTNPKCPQQQLMSALLKKITTTQDAQTAITAVKHPAASAKVLFLGVLHQNLTVVSLVLLHPNTPKYFQKLANHYG